MRARMSSRVVSGENIMRRILPSARSFWISRMNGFDDEQQEHDQHARQDVGENIEALGLRRACPRALAMVLVFNPISRGDRYFFRAMILIRLISRKGVSSAIEIFSREELPTILMIFNSSAKTWARPEKPMAMVLANSSTTVGQEFLGRVLDHLQPARFLVGQVSG